jgi:hypothetical protein
MNIKNNNPTSKSRSGLTLTTTYQNKAIREVRSSQAKSILHCETNQCHDFPTQVSKFYENPFYVSHFLVGTLPHAYHSKKKSTIPLHLLKSMVNRNMASVEDILDSWIFNCQLQYLVD